MHKGLIVVLVVLFFSVTAYAFSSVAHKNWHSRLEKGEYKDIMDETAVEDETPQNMYVIVSDPIQIFVATPEEAVFDGVELDDEEEHIDEEPEEPKAPEEPIEEHTDEETIEEPEETIDVAGEYQNETSMEEP